MTQAVAGNTRGITPRECAPGTCPSAATDDQNTPSHPIVGLVDSLLDRIGAQAGDDKVARQIKRRDVLKASAALAAVAAAGGFSCQEVASAGPIEIPTVNRLSVRVLVDGASDIFFRPQEAAGVRTEPGRSADSKRPMQSQWGLSLLLESQRAGSSRTFLHDYGWTAGTINETSTCCGSM